MKIQRASVLALSSVIASLLVPNAQATVTIQETPITSQNSVGFCWAYATTAYLEQRVRREKGGWLNLSEEYIGLYNLAEQMMAGLTQLTEGGEGSIAFDWMERYGHMPEEAFKYKVYSPGIDQRMKTATLLYKQSQGLAADAKLSVEVALTLLETELHIKHIPRSTESFNFRGKTYTPLTFAKERLGFVRSEYFTMTLVNPDTQPAVYAQEMKIIQKALLYGYSVPAAFMVFSEKVSDFSHNGIWGCKDCDKILKTDQDGGHLVLFTDFKTTGGHFGAMTLEEMKLALEQPVEAWAFKNSWGLGGSYNLSTKEPGLENVRGLPTWGAMSDGYFRASNRLAQDCPLCNLDFPTLYLNPAYDENVNQQSYVTVPSQFVTGLSSADGSLLTNGVPLTMDTAVDWSRVQVATAPAPKPPAVVFDPTASAIEAAPFSAETYGVPVTDLLAGELTVKPKQDYVAGYQFRALSPAVKSIGVFNLQQDLDDQGKPTGAPYYHTEADRVMIRETGNLFFRVLSRTAPEAAQDAKSNIKFQGLDAYGNPVGASIVREYVVHIVN